MDALYTRRHMLMLMDWALTQNDLLLLILSNFLKIFFIFICRQCHFFVHNSIEMTAQIKSFINKNGTKYKDSFTTGLTTTSVNSFQQELQQIQGSPFNRTCNKYNRNDN